MPAIFAVSFSHLLDCFICYFFLLKQQQYKKKKSWLVGRPFSLLLLNSIETARDKDATELREP